VELNEKIQSIEKDIIDFKAQALDKLKHAEQIGTEGKEIIEKAVAKVEEFGKRMTEQELLFKQTMEQKKDEPKTFHSELAKAMKENEAAIAAFGTGRAPKVEMQLKTVGTMTTAANLTGASVISYDPNPKLVPSVKKNFRELISTVPSATGSLTIYRETGTEGSISAQSTPGDPKTQIDYDFTNVTFTSQFVSGFAKYARQMSYNLPWLEAKLPEMLLRDFYKRENSIFYTYLASVATAGTETGEEIEKLIKEIGALEATDYDVNGIVVNPVDWANIAITKPSDYSLPSVVAYVGGQLICNGVPVYKASWIPEDKFLLGDWNYASRAQTEGLKVQFFEQDSDNVQRNVITARVECYEVLVVDRTQAFVLGDFGNVT
jgi:hypothetical protein